MKKLALCFSGHPRTFEQCFPSIKSKIIDKYDCDIFISTYHISKDISEKIINLYNPKKIIINDEEEINQKIKNYQNELGKVKHYQTELTDLIHFDYTHYNKKYNIEESFDYHDVENNNFVYKNINHIPLCQFYGIYQVSKLCLDYITEYNASYEYIMRLRLDDEILGEFIFDEFEENEILVNCIHKYSKGIKVHDHFYMAKPNTYFKISNLYNILPDIINFINNNKCWISTCGYPETILFLHLILSNIIIKESNFWIIKKN